jgi:retinol dehydrogenase 12
MHFGFIILIVIGSLALLALLYFGKRYFNGGVNPFRPDLRDQIVIVTGGNTGIGKTTAIEIAKLGATVIIACRDQKRGQDAKRDISQEANNQQVDFIPLDLANFESVRKFVDDFREKYSKLHILINNAGVMAPLNKLTNLDGIEIQMATNHYGHFLLTMLLLPELKKSQPSRVINLSSIAEKAAVFDLSNLNQDKSYHPWASYGNSKLANIFFSREMQKRLDRTGLQIKTAAVHPGVVRTELTRHLIKNCCVWVLYYLFFPFRWYFMKNSLQGSQTTLFCSLCDFGNLESGKFWKDCKIADPLNRDAFNDEKALKLWEISTTTCNINTF